MRNGEAAARAGGDRSAARALAAVAEVGARIAASPGDETRLCEVAALVVPAVADWCAIDLLEPDGSLERVAQAPAPPARPRPAPPADPATAALVARVLESGEPERADLPVAVLSGVAVRPGVTEATRACLAAPLTAGGRAFGVLLLGEEREDRLTPALGLSVAQDLARRCMGAVDQARVRRILPEEPWDAGTAVALLDALFEQAPVGLAQFDLDLRYVRVNDKLAEINGLPVEAHLGRAVVDVVPHFAARVVRALLRVLETGEPLVEEVSGHTRAAPDERRHWLASYYAIRPGRGAPVGAGVVVVEITARKRAEEERAQAVARERRARSKAEAAERRAAFIAEAGSVLDASLDYETTLRSLARIAVPALADWCLIDMHDDEEGRTRRVAIAHGDPEREAEAWELTRRFPSPPSSRGGPAEVLRTGRAVLHPEVGEEVLAGIAHHPDQLERLRGMGLASLMVVPLRARGRTLGSVTLATAESARRYGREDLLHACELARRAGLAVDNARLHTAVSRRSRDQSFLSESTKLLSSSLDYEGTLTRLTELAVPAIADWCTVDLVGPDGSLEPAAFAHAGAGARSAMPGLRGRHPVRLGSEHIGRVVRSGRSQLLEVAPEMVEAAAGDARHADLMRRTRCALIAPMIAAGRAVGALSLAIADSGRRFGPEDLALADELARRAAIALANARLYRERSQIARTLQQSLLPPHLPDIAGIEVAAAFHAAGEGHEVGGDFYDLFRTDPNSWAVVLGDVRGKGADAAALTALARYTLRAAAMQERAPHRIVSVLNEAIGRQRSEDEFCTVSYARLEVGEGRAARLTVVNAGHPPPLLIRAEGGVGRAGCTGTLVAGLSDLRLCDTELGLGAGDTVLFYTDGVTEARTEHGRFGEERLVALLQGCGGLSAADVVRRVEAAVAAMAPVRDDVALLALRVCVED